MRASLLLLKHVRDGCFVQRVVWNIPVSPDFSGVRLSPWSYATAGFLAREYINATRWAFVTSVERVQPASDGYRSNYVNACKVFSNGRSTAGRDSQNWKTLTKNWTCKSIKTKYHLISFVARKSRADTRVFSTIIIIIKFRFSFAALIVAINRPLVSTLSNSHLWESEEFATDLIAALRIPKRT